ncbi:hypothetical protein CEXT_69401 [Caerostris extrusa]|uniref:Uncharacterized protein n=1 Tax=Caerostris extrusa TaxID=172846 RepID=A0AAV4RJC7_CAEEX|nr:hypothetical protein CEXT_69401 [Caerostris extrusa]
MLSEVKKNQTSSGREEESIVDRCLTTSVRKKQTRFRCRGVFSVVINHLSAHRSSSVPPTFPAKKETWKELVKTSHEKNCISPDVMVPEIEGNENR